MRQWLSRLVGKTPSNEGAVRVFVGNESPLTSVDLCAAGAVAVAGTMSGGRLFQDVHPVAIGRDALPLSGETVPVVNAPVRQWQGGAVEVWSVERGRCRALLQGHRDSVLAVAVDGRGRRAVSAGADRQLRLWDLRTEAALRTRDTGGAKLMGLDLSADGRLVLAGGDDGAVLLWDTRADQVTRLAQDAHISGYGITAVRLERGGVRALLAGEDGALNVWDLHAGVCVHRLYGHHGAIAAVDLAPEGDLAVSGGADGQLRVWDLIRGTCLRTLPGHSGRITAVAMTRSGRTAISAGMSSGRAAVRVWDVTQGTCLCTFRGHRKAVSGLRLTPDEKRVLSASHDGTLQLWGWQSSHESRNRL